MKLVVQFFREHIQEPAVAGIPIDEEMAVVTQEAHYTPYLTGFL